MSGNRSHTSQTNATHISQTHTAQIHHTGTTHTHATHGTGVYQTHRPISEARSTHSYKHCTPMSHTYMCTTHTHIHHRHTLCTHHTHAHTRAVQHTTLMCIVHTTHILQTHTTHCTGTPITHTHTHLTLYTWTMPYSPHTQVTQHNTPTGLCDRGQLELHRGVCSGLNLVLPPCVPCTGRSRCW